MPTDHRAELAKIMRFDQLVAYLRDEMGWPIANGHAFEDLTFEYSPEELGIDAKNAAKIQEIKRLRPLAANQPWGIFFVKFEPKKLPVVALRRILGQVALKKRASANKSERQAWAADDLLFVSNYGEGDGRQISFAHFSKAADGHDLPTLKVLGWDNLDTALHLDAVARELSEHLAWPEDESDLEGWREQWRAAFVLRHREVVTTSKELSIRLATLARAIRDRIRTALAIETETGPLTQLMEAFRTSLVHDLDANGFADMYAQTIAYGLLSARIADPTKKTADDFAGHMRTNPFLRELMETFLKVGGRRGKAGGPGIDFDELGVSEVVELLDDANMEAVVRDFGDKNPQEDPVIHFYELFLKEYDAKKRMQSGVFYTPRPVVSYIVRSVDELLRTQFGLEDGLADTTTWGEMAKRHKDLEIPEGVSPGQDFVQILDPATGTGTFLVEVIDLIHEILVAKWNAQGDGKKKTEERWNEYVPKHLLPRLHGYELLMAPYAIAHLKIGLKLYETGYRFDSGERARVYLTNALEAAHDFSARFEFAIPALAHEAQAVNEIKRAQRFTVVIGNPPYSSSISEPPWLMTLLDDWKQGLNEVKSDLNREEWKFLRFAQHHCMTSGLSIVGFIINRDFLDGITKRRMREHLSATFPLRRVVDLNGDVKGNIADENVFEIEQGVAIAVMCTHAEQTELRFSSREGTRASKYADLLDKAAIDGAMTVQDVVPPYFRWLPLAGGEESISSSLEYAAWHPLNDIFQSRSSGIQTKNDAICIAWTADEIWNRVSFLATATPDEAARQLEIRDGGAWGLASAQKDLRQTGPSRKRVRRLLYRPFDWRFTYLTDKSGGFLGRPRHDIMKHMGGGTDNVGLIFNRQVVGSGVSHFGVSRDPICHGTFYLGNKGQDYLAPLFLVDDGELDLSGGARPHNINPRYVDAICSALGCPAIELQPLDIFSYIYGVVHSPTYRLRYCDHLKLDFPRIPITSRLSLFHELVRLGGELVALHLMESPSLDSLISRRIGHGEFRVQNVTYSDETVWIDEVRTRGFQGVAEEVWKFHVGGYQVCEKWLKDRQAKGGKRPSPGLVLTDLDIAHYQKIVVALAETIRLMQEIDEAIEQHGGWPGAFLSRQAEAVPPAPIPFRPRVVTPPPEERYATCVPLVPLKVAAGTFGDPQRIEEDEFEWVTVDTGRRLRPGMFVAQVVGKSMEPTIPDGAYCLFAAPVAGTRQGKTVLGQLRDATDPETGQRYTVKRYESEKADRGGSWRHSKIVLKPVNPDFEPIVLAGRDDGELQVVAELVEVLGPEALSEGL